ncbi:hypothetical protein CW751_08655 [Brumimicrobium salinarum]|uniref:PorV/PorQ family protein n=1 Tax=Brumimicrobium salinarum TaxID=2058658 RepID=A0A2I0R2N5_9FLAO|nr:hypothetical protein [Brumimicrobium salinarum]PKR80827.1 hypothetical protein CW751_08655 [Brumimicrobium salinarum]
MKSLLILILALFSASALQAQGWLSQGARVGAMANNGVTLIDAFSFHHNPGALGFVDKGTAGISYESRYALKELQSQSVAAAVPLKVGVISAGGQFYGYETYRTTRAGLGYSMKLSNKISAGVQINYLSTRLDPYYGVKHGVSAEFGALAKLNDRINLGFSVVNIGRAELSEFKNDRYGTILRLGISYQLLDELLLVGEIEQEINFDTRLRAGIEYHPIDLIYIRAGVQGAPMDFAFGFGLKYQRLKLDLATQYNQVLGWTPAASFIIDFYKPKQ